MKMKVAIPLFGTRISPHFTYAETALLVDIESSEVLQSREIALGPADELQRIQYFKSLEVDTLICGGISSVAECVLAEQAVNVISWVTGEARDALEQFLAKRLVPGACLCLKRSRCRSRKSNAKKVQVRERRLAMPGRDGKGPQGAGAGTGGRRGSCFTGTGSESGTGEQRGAGQGFAPRGGGLGRTFGAGRVPAEDREQVLKERAAVLERELEDVRSRIKDCTEKG